MNIKSIKILSTILMITLFTSIIDAFSPNENEHICVFEEIASSTDLMESATTKIYYSSFARHSENASKILKVN